MSRSGRSWCSLPSSARYHWEAEFLQWLGGDSAVNSVSNNANVKDYDEVQRGIGNEDEQGDEQREHKSDADAFYTGQNGMKWRGIG